MSPRYILEFWSFDGKDGLVYKAKYPGSEVYSIEADECLYLDMLPRMSEINCRWLAICNIDGEREFKFGWSIRRKRRAPIWSILKVNLNHAKRISVLDKETYLTLHGIKIIIVG